MTGPADVSASVALWRNSVERGRRTVSVSGSDAEAGLPSGGYIAHDGESGLRLRETVGTLAILGLMWGGLQLLQRYQNSNKG